MTDEKKLIAKLQDPKNAKEAFRELMRLYGEKVFWQVLKMVPNREDAEDLVQNCFIKAWKNIHNYRGDAKLSTWLYKIAVNETINFLTKERQRRGLTTDGEDAYLLSNLEADPYFDGNTLETELQKAIARLPEKQRLVFTMRYFDEMKYEEMSEILGTSVGALKASYHHAVKKVTESIKGLEFE